MKLHIQNEYPPDWPEIGDRVRAEAGHRCIRCGHRYKTGEHGKGEWTPCDDRCTHNGPLRFIRDGEEWTVIDDDSARVRDVIASGVRCEAQWRILTVHHLDGDKANCEWWNLLSLCQRCHLQVQTTVDPHTPFFLEHSAWFRPYVAGFYAHKYEGRNITRAEAVERMDELLGYERLA